MATSITAPNMLLLLIAFVTATAHLINAKQNSWTAGRYFPSDTYTSKDYTKRVSGVIKHDNIKEIPVRKHDADLIASLPDSFDPREKWPNCPSLNEISDEGACAGGWAFGPAEIMTDRVCTYSNGTKNFHFSAQDILSCVSGYDNMGCNGGYVEDTYDYWQNVGVVSGGIYNSSEGCRPYEVAPCEHSATFVLGDIKPCEGILPTSRCKNKCIEGYNVEYEKDKHRIKNYYTVRGEDDIKAELFKNGPVTAIIALYNDFFSYRTGVYKSTEEYYEYSHTIRILGWGVEGGEKYWLLANSWNTDWGDNGFIKFLRGEDHCDIESYILAGEPILDYL